MFSIPPASHCHTPDPCGSLWIPWEIPNLPVVSLLSSLLFTRPLGSYLSKAKCCMSPRLKSTGGSPLFLGCNSNNAYGGKALSNIFPALFSGLIFCPPSESYARYTESSLNVTHFLPMCLCSCWPHSTLWNRYRSHILPNCTSYYPPKLSRWCLIFISAWIT